MSGGVGGYIASAVCTYLSQQFISGINLEYYDVYEASVDAYP